MMKSLKIPKGSSEAVNRLTDNTIAERKKDKTVIYKTLHTKLKIQQHEPYLQRGVNSCPPEGLKVPDTQATPAMLLLNDTNII